MTDLCPCGQPTRDHAYICDNCADGLARNLGDIPGLADELDTSIARQQGVDYRRVGGGSGARKPAETPHPANMGASDAKTALRDALTAWVKFSHTEGIRHSSPSDELPEPTLAAMSRWLLWRVDGLALNEQGPAAADAIGLAVEKCWKVVDRPADRQYLGPCDQCDGGRFYSSPGKPFAYCNACGSATDAQEKRDGLIGELDDRLCTASEIAHLSTFLGLRANREQVRKRINQWHRRGVITKEATFGDEVVFRFGIVWRLLVQGEDDEATA